MTAPTQRPPVKGPLFREAARRPVEGHKRRLLLCLRAAHADSGHPVQPAVALAGRLGWDAAKVGALLRRLEADGYVSRRKKSPRGWRYRPLEEAGQ